MIRRRKNSWGHSLAGLAAMVAVAGIGAAGRAALAQAPSANPQEPVYLEADKGTFDDAKKEAVFTGNVILTQGGFMIKADRMVVKQDADGFQKGFAYGAPATFRQKRPETGELIEGWANRLEYDGRTELLEMFDDARMQRGQDEVRGAYISYNVRDEFFKVLGSTKEVKTGGQSGGRVRAVIQPKGKDGADAAGSGAKR
jgi:lipopolysaccharide export system protein LptA